MNFASGRRPWLSYHLVNSTHVYSYRVNTAIKRYKYDDNDYISFMSAGFIKINE